MSDPFDRLVQIVENDGPRENWTATNEAAFGDLFGSRYPN